MKGPGFLETIADSANASTEDMTLEISELDEYMDIYGLDIDMMLTDR